MLMESGWKCKKCKKRNDQSSFNCQCGFFPVFVSQDQVKDADEKKLSELRKNGYKVTN